MGSHVVSRLCIYHASKRRKLLERDVIGGMGRDSSWPRQRPPLLLMANFLFLSSFATYSVAADRPPNDDKVTAAWVSSNILVNQTHRVVQGEPFAGSAGVDYVFQNFTASGTNSEATMEEDEPSHGSYETSKSVWWKWFSPINATMRVSTMGSQFDTAMGIYKLVPWDGATVTNEFGVRAVHYGKSDDVLWNKDLISSALFTAHAGEVYYIAVGGFRGTNGSISLIGTVEAYILPPPVIPQVQQPVFTIERVGEARDAGSPLHDKFAQISLSTTTPGADIFYTLDLSTPTIRTLFSGEQLAVGVSTMRFTEPIPMGTITIRAVAFKAGMRESLVATSTAFQLQATAPEIFPDGGSYNVSAQFSIFFICDEEKGDVCTVRYTLDGSEPDATSPEYSVPVTLSNASGTVVRAALWVLGMERSNVTTSQAFFVLPKLDTPIIHPAGTQCGFALLQRCSSGHVQYDTSVNVSISAADPNATIYFTLDASLKYQFNYREYTGPLQLGAGVHRVTAFVRRPGWTDSERVTGVFEVLQAIEPLGFGQQRVTTLSPGRYLFYRLNVTNVRSDIVVSVTSFFGQADIALSAHVKRPMEIHGDNRVYWSRAAAGQGSRLSILHTDFDFDVDEVNGTAVYVSIRGASAVPTQLLLAASVDISPVIRLSEIYQANVDYGKWRYFKFYMGQRSPGSEPMRNSLNIQVVQSLQLPIGVRVAFKEGGRPTDSDMSVVLNTATGNDKGVFDLRVPVSQRAEVYYVGVRGLYAVAPSFNFTLVVNNAPVQPEIYTSVPKNDGVPACECSTCYTGDCMTADILPGRMYTSSVPSARMKYFAIHPTANSQTLILNVTEMEDFTGGLQLLLQQDVHPTVAANSNATVVRNATRRTYTLTYSLSFGHKYILGIFGYSYTRPLYNFSLVFDLVNLPSAPRPGGGVPTIASITNNYRYAVYSVMWHPCMYACMCLGRQA